MGKNQVLSKITRISPDQAMHFIACKDDQLDTPANYFTLQDSVIPHDQTGGWQSVEYYTNRPRHIKMPKGLIGVQYIYILSNETMPGLVKVGFTKNKPTDRAKQINAATGVALDFKVEWQYPCFNAHALEGEIHAYLEFNGFRVNKKKEFFNISVEQARSVIERIGEPYKMMEDEE